MRFGKSSICLLAGVSCLCLAWASYVGWRARGIAHELTDPPFYQPQPLERVDATFQELAQGGLGDPGGTWSSEQIDALQLWTLHRAKQGRGLVLLLHGFGDDRWGTSPALRWFPDLDAAIFTYLGRDDALRRGGRGPYVTFGARESDNVVRIVHHLEQRGMPRHRIILMGRSLGASVGILALAKLEADGRGPLGGIIWEGAPAGSRDFGERLVRGPADRWWHPWIAPLAANLGSHWAAWRGGYDRDATDPRIALRGRHIETPALCILALQDRLAPPPSQREMGRAFRHIRWMDVPTWHLHSADILGPAYGALLQETTQTWLP